MISGSFAAALMVGLSREHSLPFLVSPRLRASGPFGPLQGSGTLVNPSSVGVFCWGGWGMPFEWLAATCLSIKVHTHHYTNKFPLWPPSVKCSVKVFCWGWVGDAFLSGWLPLV